MTLQPRKRKWLSLALAAAFLAGCGGGEDEQPRPRRRARRRKPAPTKKTTPPKAQPPAGGTQAGKGPAGASPDARTKQITDAIAEYVNPRSRKRQAAEKTLNDAGMNAIPLIAAAIKGREPEQAGRLLGFFPRADARDPAILPAILERAHRFDANQQALAASWVAKAAALTGGPAAVLKAVDDPNLCVHALNVLTHYVQDPVVIEGTERIAARLDDGDPVVRAYAGVLLNRLAPLDKRAAEGLAAALSIPDDTINAAGIDGIGILGPDAAAAAEALGRYIALGTKAYLPGAGAYRRFRWKGEATAKVGNAPAALEAIGPRAAKAVGVLVEGALAGGPRAAAACQALLRLRPDPAALPAEKFVDAYVRTGGREYPRVLALCGPEAAPALVEAWKNVDAVNVAPFGAGIVEYCRLAGPRAAPAAGALLEMCLWKDSKVVSAARSALVAIGPAAAGPLAKAFTAQYKLARSGRSEERSSPRAGRPRPGGIRYTYTPAGKQARDLAIAALDALAGLGEGAGEAVEAVARAARDGDRDILAGVLRVLAAAGNVSATVSAGLLNSLKDTSSPLYRDRALREPAVRLLARAASSQPALLTRVVALGLGTDVLAALAEQPPTNPTCATILVAEMNRNPSLRARAIAVLSAMGPDARSAAAALGRLAQGRDSVAAAARAALARIDPAADQAVEARIARYAALLADRSGRTAVQAALLRDELLDDLDHVLKVVFRLVRTGTDKQRKEAFAALRGLGPAAAGAADALADLAAVPPATGPADFSRNAEALHALAVVRPDEATAKLVLGWLSLGRTGNRPPQVNRADEAPLRRKIEAAALAARELGETAGGIYPLLARIVQERRQSTVYDSDTIRSAFLAVTARLGPEAPRLVPKVLDSLLAEAVRKERGQWRADREVLAAIGAMGPAAAPAGPRLLEMYRQSRLDDVLFAIHEVGIHDYATAALQRDAIAVRLGVRSRANLTGFLKYCAPSARATAGLLRVAREWDPAQPVHGWVLEALMRTAVPAADLQAAGVAPADIEGGLRATLQTPHPSVLVKGAYLRALLLDEKQAADELVGMMLRPDPTRWAAALKRWRAYRGPRFIPLGYSTADGLRPEAAALLKKLGSPPQAVAAVTAALRPGAPLLDWRIVQELDGKPAQIVPAVLRARPVRHDTGAPICDLLAGATGPTKAVAVAYLTWRLKATPRDDAFRALLSYDLPTEQLMPLLRLSLEQKVDPNLVLTALRAAGKMGPAAAGLIEQVRRCTAAPHGPAVRQAARLTLRQIAGEGKPAGSGGGPSKPPATAPAATRPAGAPVRPAPTPAKVSDPKAASRLRMAELMLNAGNEPKCVEILRELITTWPDSIEADKARQRLKELGRKPPATAPAGS